MGKKRFTSKTYLKVLIVVGLLAVVGGGAGTFATFNAEVTNSGNTFANGTLFLHATPNSSVTACTSESDTISNSGTCTFLFNDPLTGGAHTATLQLHNAGTINASDIKFNVSGCTPGDNSDVTHSSVVFGPGPTCADLQLAVQETEQDFSTPVYCAYPVAAGSCTIDATHNLTTAVSPITLKTTAGHDATLPATSDATGDRYYVITIDPNVGSDNTLQNRKVTFALTWHIDQ